MRIVAAVLILALLVAGCAQSGKQNPPAGGQQTNSSSNGTATTQTETAQPSPGPGGSLPPPIEAFVSSCEEWTTGLVGPTDQFGGPLPPGWEPSQPAATQLIQFNTCERLSWGTFERGPLHLIFEFSEDFDSPPETCARGDPGRMHILRALWVDDAEVASWLIATYGLPVRTATIEVEETTTGVAINQTWTWAEANGVPSNIQFDRPVVEQDTALTYRQRLFWFTPTSTGYMDWDESDFNDDYASPVAHGTLNEPMTYAAWTGLTEYVAGVDRVYGVDSTISISLFNDFLCKQERDAP